MKELKSQKENLANRLNPSGIVNDEAKQLLISLGAGVNRWRYFQRCNESARMSAADRFGTSRCCVSAVYFPIHASDAGRHVETSRNHQFGRQR
jgi:hypothetical protein